MSDPVKVDSHVHLYRSVDEGNAEKEGYEVWEYGTKSDVAASAYPGTVDNILEAMDASDMAKVVVVNLFIAQQFVDEATARLPEQLSVKDKDNRIKEINATVADELKAFNQWICDVARDQPKIIPFVGVDPSVLSNDDCAQHARNMIESQGAKGVKLHGAACGFNMSDERLWPMYAVCEALGAPIIAHSGPDRQANGFAEPQAFGRMLKAFPRLRVVLAHMGGATWAQALEIANTYPNAYFDCCEIIEWTDAPNAPSETQLVRLIKDIGTERVMMGSDFPWYDLDHTVERIMELPGLSIEEKEGILGANAVRILNLQ